MFDREADGAPVRYARDGAVAWIVMDRPDKLNALSPEAVDGLAVALDRAEADREARVIALTGAGSSFCAGADLSRVLDRDADGAGLELPDFLRSIGRVCTRIAEHPLPVIAAVHGNAVAGGLELLLACDLVVASEDARIGDGHARYGMFPGAGGLVRLPARIGATRAKYLLFTAESWGAEQMREVGLVNQVVPRADLESAVQRLGMRLAGFSAAGIAGMKRVVERGADLPAARALELELAECEAYIAAGGDFDEGLRAFRDRRKPSFARR